MNIFKKILKSNKAAQKPVATKMFARVIKKQESITRKDIADWKIALQEARRVDTPKQTKLQNLYDTIMLDALLTSQINLRIDKTQGADFKIFKSDGKENEAATQIIKDLGLYDSLSELIIESKLYGNSLVEFTYDNSNILTATLIPRSHVSPETGMFYPDLNTNKGEDYRSMPEFGKWIVEFASRPGDFGILNKAVPHVLMKKFAQSCWSELCEIYGIPPRVLKTNTTDTEMLNRAESMMRDIGSAAWWIIDTTESLEFAQGVSTNGDVYNNFISICNNEISMLTLGAVLGQDTVNGNRSKEESSSKLLDSIVLADRRYVESCFNHIVLPALAQIGVIKDGVRLSIVQETDIGSLWKMTNEAAANFDVDPAWVKDKFGIEVTGSKTFNGTQKNMSNDTSLSEAENLDFFV